MFDTNSTEYKEIYEKIERIVREDGDYTLDIGEFIKKMVECVDDNIKLTKEMIKDDESETISRSELERIIIRIAFFYGIPEDLVERAYRLYKGDKEEDDRKHEE